MKPVPRKAKDEEDSITELKKQTEERPIIKQQEAPDTCCATKEAPKEEAKEAAKENGYLTVIKNVPFLCVMLANLPAVMGLYIPYMFLPGVSAVGVAASQTCKRCFTLFGIESASLKEGTFSTLGIEASLQNSLFLDVFQFPECSEYSEASLTCLGHTYFADIYIAMIAPLFQICRQSYAKVQTLTLDLKQRFSPLPVSLHKPSAAPSIDGTLCSDHAAARPVRGGLRAPHLADRLLQHWRPHRVRRHHRPPQGRRALPHHARHLLR